MRRLVATVFFLVAALTALHASERGVLIPAPWGSISATLATADTGSDTAVLIVAGSGPTDRNGNSGLGLNTYTYKMLSDGLVRSGYDVLRYDKRAIGESRYEVGDIAEVVFDDFVDDAALCVAYLRSLGYQRVVVAGHSEGGSIALRLALREDVAVDGLVLLCAPGYPMDAILMKQLAAQLVPQYLGLMASATNIINTLKRGEMVAEERVPRELMSLFHPSVQRFLISSMADDPRDIAARVEVPMLIITGGHDVQVSVDNGEALLAAQPAARHLSFERMSHVLKDAATAERVEQLVSVYNNSQLPLTEPLVPTIHEFINNLK